MHQSDDQTRAAIRCAFMMVGVVAAGTLGFWLIEKEWDLWKSLFFTLITITTVGYGDEGISEAGRRFAVILLICGIGTFTYSLSTLVQFAVDREAALIRKMNRKIKDCTGHIIVCGYGRMGRTVCERLAEEESTCVVIEPGEDNYNRAVQDGHLAILGDGSSDDVLKKAQVERATGVVCAVDSDAENMFITVSVRDLNSNCQIISRAENEGAARKLERAGATMVFSPHQMAGQSIASAMLHPHLSRFMQRIDNRLQLGETEVDDDSPLAGRTVEDFGQEAESVVFVAIERPGGETIMRPGGHVEFQHGDVVIFAGTTNDLRAMQAASCEAISA